MELSLAHEPVEEYFAPVRWFYTLLSPHFISHHRPYRRPRSYSISKSPSMIAPVISDEMVPITNNACVMKGIGRLEHEERPLPPNPGEHE